MKTYIRTLQGKDPKPLWDNDTRRERLRLYLNDKGFYVFTGPGDSLDVYISDHTKIRDIRLAQKILDKLERIQYTLIMKQKEATPKRHKI